jgi:hypothetical protein
VPRPDPITFETIGPREIQIRISADPAATARLFAFLDARGERHAAELSGAALAAAAGTDGRNWRRWISEDKLPLGAARAIYCAAYHEET